MTSAHMCTIHWKKAYVMEKSAFGKEHLGGGKDYVLEMTQAISSYLIKKKKKKGKQDEQPSKQEKLIKIHAFLVLVGSSPDNIWEEY